MANRFEPAFQPAACLREESDDVPTSPPGAPTFGDVVAARFGRRDILKGLAGAAALSAITGPLALADTARAEAPVEATRFPFPELTAAPDQDMHVAGGHDAQVLIRWGDAVLADAPAFDPTAQSAAAQAKQFGYNNDFLGFIPLPGAPDGASHGLLVANHEYTNEELMFPGLGVQSAKTGYAGMTRELVDIEMAAHGGSVIEIRRGPDGWQVVPGSRFARRITAETPMIFTGPAAGSHWLKTSADAEGRSVKGMLNNCAGGVTPWGTWLTCEENFNTYFNGKAPEGADPARLKRYGLPNDGYAWFRFHDRFDMAKEPNEANRFGWVVEIDPLDPAATPKKRTALGRFKHEGAANVVNKDGRFVVYQGDDSRMEHIYRFVTDAKVDLANPAANADILDEGTLAVAVFHKDGTGEWRPLVHGEGPLTAANGFADQADILVNARLAASALEATRMDRPEDVEVNPKTDKVYVMLTNNDKRAEGDGAANPRARNVFGHIVEITPAGRDHAAKAFTWEILVQCGDPRVAETAATFSPATSDYGWFANPDNCAVDHEGRLWVATDGNSPDFTGRTDGIWGVETEGAGRATAKRFFSVPVGAEMCGPYFTADDTTFFVAVQHPGQGEKGQPSTFDAPLTRWPDFKDGMPPRPAVVAITRKGGGKVGS